jgi:hypothetical protein
MCARLFRSLGVTNWIDGSKDTITDEDYTFAAFMTELREQFLESGWAKKLYRSEIKRAMLPNQRFVDYANRVIYYNIILKGTGNHSDDNKLRDTLSHNMSEGLVNKLDTLAVDERTRINDIVGLNMWVREVETVDRIWKTDIKNTAILMNEMMNRRNREEARNTARQPDHRTDPPARNENREETRYQANRSRPDENRDENRYHPYRSHPDRDRNDRDRDQDRGYKYRNNDREQDRGYTRTRDNGYNRGNDQRTFNNRTNDKNYNRPKRCPPLTQNERDLLHEHDGCNKCRKFYTDCRGRDCENWPDAHSYRTLTLQDALDAKARKANKMDSRNTVGATIPHSGFEEVYNASVAALLGNNPSYEAPGNMYDSRAERAMSAPPTSHIREVNAILPSSSIPFNLGNGSDTSDENALNHEVSDAPLSVEHLTWDANIFGGNSFPTKINCMLDNGAHLVLIRPETVADLALPIRKLEQPISVTLALEGKKTITTLHDYVHLQLASTNNEWSSKTVRALIAPGLCTNILLGLPFLTHNNIVVDHSARTAINKMSGFDLMNNKAMMPRDKIKKMVPPKVKV